MGFLTLRRMVIGCGLVLLLGTVAGCDRYIESRDPLRSVPTDGPVPTALKVYLDDQSVTLDWVDNDSALVVRYRVYAADSVSGRFEVEDSTALSRITLNNLVVNRLYLFRVAAVDASGLEWQPSEIVSARISPLSLILAGGDEFTSSRSIQARLVAPSGASYLRLSEDSAFTGVQYDTYASTRTIELSTGDGVKYVYAEIQFSSGAETVHPLVDSITLDTRVAIDSVFFQPSGSTFTLGDTILFRLDAGEAGGTATVTFGLGETVSLDDNGTGADGTANDGIYSGWYVVNNLSGAYESRVFGSFIDAAGNEAENAAVERLNINVSAPDPIELVAFVDGDATRFSWTESDEPDFASYRVYRGTSASVNNTSGTLVFFSDDRSETFGSIDSPSGTSYYRLYIFDEHGAAAGSSPQQVVAP